MRYESLAYKLASSVLWAVKPDFLENVLAVLSGEAFMTEYKAYLQTMAEVAFKTNANLENFAELAFNNNPALKSDMEAVMNKDGQELQKTRTGMRRDGIAIIPVQGAIFRRANMFGELCGSQTSVQVLAKDIKAAVDDPSVNGIILDIDSPGGEVNGISELAGQIASYRGIKPIKSYVGYLCASAAYWLAASTDEIIIHKGANVGSIGVVGIMGAEDKSKRKFISSQSPYKQMSAETEEGARLHQQEVDRAAQLFIDDIAGLRGVTVDTVLSDFGQGWLKVGNDAVSAKMADRLGTLEGLIADMKREAIERGRKAASFSASTIPLLTSEEENMANEILQKMLAGLSVEERAALLAETPAPSPAAASVEPAKTPTVSSDLLMRAVNAESKAFFAQMAGRVTPAELATAQATYLSLAVLDDQSPLNNYKASIQARPVSPLLTEQITSQTVVLPATKSADETNPQTEAAELERLLGMTDDGKQAMAKLKAGELKPAYKQFALA